MNNAALAQELQALEERLLQPAVRADRASLEALLCPDVMEFGSSGRVFDREEIVTLLATEVEGRRTHLADFACDLLAPGVALVTYRSLPQQAGEVLPGSLRSSIRVERDGRWEMRFHQGTRALH